MLSGTYQTSSDSAEALDSGTTSAIVEESKEVPWILFDLQSFQAFDDNFHDCLWDSLNSSESCERYIPNLIRFNWSIGFGNNERNRRRIQRGTYNGKFLRLLARQPKLIWKLREVHTKPHQIQLKQRIREQRAKSSKNPRRYRGFCLIDNACYRSTSNEIMHQIWHPRNEWSSHSCLEDLEHR